MWHYGFVAAVSSENCLNKTRLCRGGCILYTHTYTYTLCMFLWGQTRCKGVFGVEGVYKIRASLAHVQKHPLKQTAFLLLPSVVQSFFCFFTMLEGDLILSPVQGERLFVVAFRVPSLDISYDRVIWQPVEDLDCGFTCGAGNTSSCSLIPARLKGTGC